MKVINSLGQDVTQEALEKIRALMGYQGPEEGYDLKKAATVTTANNLTAYDLEAPSKSLYPVLTPLRNRVPRRARRNAGKAANWEEVKSITGSGISSMGWVPEGQRAGRMALETSSQSATYVTLGEEADSTMEAQHAGEGFEDVQASTTLRVVQSLMLKEESAILGGNKSYQLGQPDALSLAADGDSGSLPAATYRITCFALTFEGYVTASLEAGIKRDVTIEGQDGKSFKLNGGSSPASVTATQAVTAGQTLTASVPVVRGAVAYAWFVGASAATQRLEAITTINSVAITELAGAHQLLSSINDTALDCSNNQKLAFDGLLYNVYASDQSFFHAMPTGNMGEGTPLTASKHGTIVEIDNMLEWLWDKHRLGPDELYVSAQELKNIRDKVLTGSDSSLVRFTIDLNASNPTAIAGQVIGYYVNPFTIDGGQLIPIRLHPTLPKGTIFAWCQDLPAQYQSANVPEAVAMLTRRDIYQISWAQVTRANEVGVYCEEVLACYAKFALAVITNIGNG